MLFLSCIVLTENKQWPDYYKPALSWDLFQWLMLTVNHTHRGERVLDKLIVPAIAATRPPRPAAFAAKFTLHLTHHLFPLTQLSWTEDLA